MYTHRQSYDQVNETRIYHERMSLLVMSKVGKTWTPLGKILKFSQLSYDAAVPYLITLVERREVEMVVYDGCAMYRTCEPEWKLPPEDYQP